MLLRTSATLFALGLVVAQSVAWGTDSPFSILLRQHARATDPDLKLYTQDRGVFAKILQHTRRGEIAAAGAVRIPVTIDFFVERFRDIETFKKGPAVLGIGKFTDPPREENLGRLTLGSKALNELARCRPGKCSLKLSAEMMNRLRSAAASVGRGPALEREFRAVLSEYVSGYWKNGSRAMIIYNDTNPPLHTFEEFIAVLGQFSWLGQYAPVLFNALKDPLRNVAPRIEEFLYWSKESFGLKPVVSITHVLILRTTIEGRPWAFLASKQIYADHYFETSLGLTVIAEESADSANPMVSVGYFNRSQSDGLRGWFASVQRSIVERRTRAAMAKSLSAMRDKLGKDYRGRGQ